jgi:hypothetical protein
MYGLNQVLTNKVKRSKYTTWSSIFIARFVLAECLRVICQLDVVHNWPSKMPQKVLDDKLFFFFDVGKFIVIQMPLHGALGVCWIKPVPCFVEPNQ